MATNPEQLLISAVLLESDHVTPSANGITADLFHAYPDEWEWIQDYISKHRRTPSKSAFKMKFPEFRIKSVDDVKHFCDEVRKQHTAIELQGSMQEAIEFLRRGDVEKALNHLSVSTMRTKVQNQGAGNDSDIFDNWQDVFTEAERRYNRQKNFGQAGIPTGFPTLDSRTGGPQPGHLWVVAARLGQGKTWSLVRMAVAAAFSGLTVQYDALEQTRNEISMRVVTFMSSEYGQQVFKNLDQSMGTMTSMREYRDFLASMRSHVNGKFHIADTSYGPINPLSIAAQMERNKPDALYLDYLTLMDHGDAEAWRGVAKLSASLKALAQGYGIPIIAAAQLNRTAISKNDPAGPEALAESDAIGRDADAVITMVQLSKRIIKMKLAKYRHGRDGFSWYCKFSPNTGHFEEVSFDDAQDVINEDKDEEDEEIKFVPRQKGSYSNAGPKKLRPAKPIASAPAAKPATRRIIRKK